MCILKIQKEQEEISIDTKVMIKKKKTGWAHSRNPSYLEAELEESWFEASPSKNLMRPCLKKQARFDGTWL
jgi:hypothetical protein